MAVETQKMKKRVNKLWRATVARTVASIGARIEGVREEVRRDVERLRDERDRLLVHLGEQTLHWLNQNPVPVPSVVKPTIERLNRVIEHLRTHGHHEPVRVRHSAEPVIASSAFSVDRTVTKKASGAKATKKKTAAKKKSPAKRVKKTPRGST